MSMPDDERGLIELDSVDSIPLLRAAASGDAAHVAALLENGTDISTRDDAGFTALHLAAQAGHEGVVRLLLESGADIHARNVEGWPPLFYAIGQGNMAIIRLCIGNETDLSVFDETDYTALRLAALLRRPEAIDLFLDMGSDVGARDRFGWTALHTASRSGCLQSVKILLERGADIKAETLQQSTPLHIAGEAGKPDMVRLLLAEGADIAVRARDGWTVLHRTADGGHEETAQLLIDQGADVKPRDNVGATPLHRAAARGHEAMVRLLLSKGADIESRDGKGHRPLHVAANTRQYAIVELLLKLGAEVNAQDSSNGFTALHGATLDGNKEIMRILLENNAEGSLEDNDKNIALFYAAGSEDAELVKILVEAVPGLADMFAKRGQHQEKPEDEKFDTELQEAYAALNVSLHNLCEICKQITFSSLHSKEECKSIGCNYFISSHDSSSRPFNRLELEDHSFAYKHYPNLDMMVDAARNGCHLCSLLAFGLQHSYEHLIIGNRQSYSLSMEGTTYGAAEGGVALVYHKSSKWAKSEELEVFYGDRFALFAVTNPPLKRCSNPGFNELGLYLDQDDDDLWDYMPRDLSNVKALFHARCTRPNHPVWGYKSFDQVDQNGLGGYPKIQSYLPGQIVSVYAVRGKFWLASFIYGIPATLPGQHHNHLRFGWVDSTDYVRLKKAPHPSCDCGKGVWEAPLLSTPNAGQSAYLAEDVSSEEVFSLISNWMSLCDETHSYCHAPDTSPLPLRVLDVGTANIAGLYPEPFLSIGTDRFGQYTTLSYRWGDGLTLTTNTSTLNMREAVIPLSSMPQTFQDAVLVTRRLGFRYMWIDALCIVQDSVKDWQEQSALMGQIYSNASLNISVSENDQPLGGFLRRRNPLEIRSCRHPNLLSTSQRSNGELRSSAKVVCPSIPRHDRLLNKDIINSRGWILQERGLSKRTIHFGLFEVYWECLISCASEREPEGSELLWPNASQFDRESQDRRRLWNTIRTGVQYLVNPEAVEILERLGPEGMTFPCHDEDHQRWVLRNLSISPKERKTLQFPCSNYHEHHVYAPADITPGQFAAAHHLWYLLIQEYTLRSLTKRKDMLPALSGLARVFQKTLGLRSKYVAGIWSGDFINGLTWNRYNPRLKPSPEILPKSTPSFSWASINSPVSFDSIRRNRLTEDQRYEAEILDFSSTPVGLDLLGEVSGGFIKLKAYTMPFTTLIKEFHQGRTVDYSIFDRDEPDLEPLDKRILCVNIRHISTGYLGEEPSVLRQCLLLVSTDDTSDSTYCRVGYWTSKIRQRPRPVILGGVDYTEQLRGSEPIDESIDYDQPIHEGWEEKILTIV